jgi:hypothetical protein
MHDMDFARTWLRNMMLHIWVPRYSPWWLWPHAAHNEVHSAFVGMHEGLLMFGAAAASPHDVSHTHCSQVSAADAPHTTSHRPFTSHPCQRFAGV